MKNTLFPCILLLISSNTAFSQCEQHIFSISKKSIYSDETVLMNLCAANTDLEWEVVDSTSKVLHTKRYEYFKEMVKYYTHFSNVLENAAGRQFATVSLKDEKTDKMLTSSILSLAFYYEYQCDSLISTFNKYHISWYGSPTEYVGSLVSGSN